MKTEVFREYERRITVNLKSKLKGKNKIKVINTLVIAILRYDASILEWRVEKLKELDRKNQKLDTVHEGLHQTVL